MRRLILARPRLRCAALAMISTGCGTNTGDVLVKYTRGTEPVPPTEAPRDGLYGLYSASDLQPQVKYPLQKGDRLGFIRQGTEVAAVAGETIIPIKTKTLVRTYAWKLELQTRKAPRIDETRKGSTTVRVEPFALLRRSRRNSLRTSAG